MMAKLASTTIYGDLNVSGKIRGDGVLVSGVDADKLDGKHLTDLKITVTGAVTASQIAFGSDGTVTLNTSLSTHTHDDRYYIESEIDSQMAGKSDVGHTHSYLPLAGGTMSGAIAMGSNNISGAGTVSATTFQENGTNLASKYLGIAAKAADSDKLDNIDSTGFLRIITDGTTDKVTISNSKFGVVGGSNISITYDDTNKKITIANTYSYSHPTGDGNLHVPATSTTNNTKVLKAGSTAGSISWGSVDWTELTNKPSTFSPSSHNHPNTEITGLGGAATLNVGTAAGTVAAGNDSRFHANTNDPTADQKAALTGTSGTPSSTNKYVTNSDSRLSDARTPTAHTHVKNDITDFTHTHSDATTSVAGFMSAADKTKLDGVATNANNYTHPTGDGNLHVPATSTTNNTKVLKAGSTAGSLSWGSVAYSELTGVPSTFAPSAHKSSHASGGSDVLSPADIGAAAASHGSHVPTGGTSGQYLKQGNSWSTITISEVSGLQGALDGKAATSHNHDTVYPSMNSTSVDADTITRSGFYHCNANVPTTDGESDKAIIHNQYGPSSVWATQIAISWRNGRMWFRNKENGTWESWQEVSKEHSHPYLSNSDSRIAQWESAYTHSTSSHLALGETSSTAYQGDRGKTAYNHSQEAHARTDATLTESSLTNGNIKINGTETTVYTHPTGDGNLHVPATSTTNNTKVLKAGATAGSLSWGVVAYSELSGVPSTFTPSSHNHPNTEITGLGDSATKNVGTASGTVAAGNDSRFHSNANDPSADQKAALAGTSGTPSDTNKYVTNDDSRMTNARTPSSHGNEAHSSTFVTQTEITNSISTHAGNATVHHSNANDPTGDQKAALAGTSGTPSSTNKYVTDGDSRLSDARTPTSHGNDKHSATYVTQTEINTSISTHAGSATAHHSNVNDPSSDQKAALAGTSGTPSGTNKYVTNADSRLSDARTPTSHTHPNTEITGLGDSSTKNVGTATGTVAAGDDARFHSNANDPTSDEKAALAGTGTPSGTNKYVTNDDSRLSDSRTPTTHNHAAGDINSGTLGVARGGTGIDSYTANNYLRASGSTTLEQRTPSQVLSDIGAAAASDLTGHINSQLHIPTFGANELNYVLSVIGNDPLYSTAWMELNKNRVGLPNVEDYGIASQVEAEAGTSSTKYMTPLRTKQAIAALQAVSSVAGKTGAVTLSASDVGAAASDHTHTGYLASSGGTLTGNMNFADYLAQSPEIKDYSETVKAQGTTGGAKTINIEDGNVHTITLSSNTTFTFSNPSASGKACSLTIILTQDSTVRSVTWPASVKWPDGNAPSLAGASTTYVLSFLTIDGGTTWFAWFLGSAFA